MTNDKVYFTTSNVTVNPNPLNVKIGFHSLLNGTEEQGV